MGREIKLRAWNGEEMIYQSKNKEYDDYYMLTLEGRFYGHTRTGDEYFDFYEDELNKKNYILMQYTGLKTKDGAEIYEGDILGGYPHGTSKIVWDDKYACWSAHWIEQQIDEDGGEFDVDCSSMLHYELDNCKDTWTVLGNIYSNPELLK